MNQEQIHELKEAAMEVVFFSPSTGSEQKEFNIEKFAELIVRECMLMCEETQAAYLKQCKASYDFKDKNIYAEGERASDIIKHKIKKRFGVEETQGWVCPNCGTDRTKAACPKGHTAALTGDCPMHGVAHGAAQ